MDINTANALKQKNKELIQILIEKIRKEYKDDIDLIGICGSFFTGDFHEKSDLELNFSRVLHAESVSGIKEASAILIKTVKDLYREIEEKVLAKPVPTRDNLRGTYEEVWSNWKNKIHYAAEQKDVLLAFSSGEACQDFYNEMHRDRGTAPINLMKDFQPHDLDAFADAFEKAMELYKGNYDKLGMQVASYDTIDEFRKDYLGL